MQHDADHRRGDGQSRSAPDELPPADDAVDASLDQTVDALEIVIPIRTGNKIDHRGFLLLMTLWRRQSDWSSRCDDLYRLVSFSLPYGDRHFLGCGECRTATA